MAGFVISVLWMLVAVCLVVGLYYVCLWVFAQLGIPVPVMAVKIAMVILVLLIIIWFVSALFGGGGFQLPFRN